MDNENEVVKKSLSLKGASIERESGKSYLTFTSPSLQLGEEAEYLSFGCFSKEAARLWQSRIQICINNADGIATVNLANDTYLVGCRISGQGNLAGWLKKHATTGTGIAKKKWFVLTDQYLLYMDIQGDPVKRQWILEGASMTVDSNMPNRSHLIFRGHVLTRSLTSGGSEEIILTCETSNELMKWRNAFMSAGMSRKKPTTNTVAATSSGAKTTTKNVDLATVAVAPKTLVFKVPEEHRRGEKFKLTLELDLDVGLASGSNNFEVSYTVKTLPAPKPGPDKIDDTLRKRMLLFIRANVLEATAKMEQFTFKQIRLKVLGALNLDVESFSSKVWKSWFKEQTTSVVTDMEKDKSADSTSMNSNASVQRQQRREERKEKRDKRKSFVPGENADEANEEKEDLSDEIEDESHVMPPSQEALIVKEQQEEFRTSFDSLADFLTYHKFIQ